MKMLYIALSIVALCYCLFRNRKIDFFTIYIFSTLIYYFPAYIGYIYISENNYIMISPKTYLVLTINLFIIIWFVAIFDLIKVPKNKGITLNIVNNSHNNRAILVISIATLGFLLFSTMQYGLFTGNGFDKTQLLSNSNRLIEYGKYFATFTFVYAFTNQGKWIFFIRLFSTISILYTFILGHRSFLVIGIICIIYILLVSNSKYKSVFSIIKRKKRIIIPIAIFSFFILFVKNIFAAFMSGDYDLVFERLTSKEYYINTFLQSEPNTITNNLNNVLYFNMDYNLTSYLLIIFVGLIPYVGNLLLNEFNIQSFEYLLQLNFNTRLGEGIGLGSTFLGETYSTGGYMFLFLVSITICFLIALLEWKIYNSPNTLLRTWLIIFLCYLTFYISRNSLIFILVAARAYLYIFILSWIIKKFIETFYKRFGNNRL